LIPEACAAGTQAHCGAPGASRSSNVVVLGRSRVNQPDCRLDILLHARTIHKSDKVSCKHVFLHRSSVLVPAEMVKQGPQASSTMKTALAAAGVAVLSFSALANPAPRPQKRQSQQDPNLGISSGLQNILANTHGSDLYTYPTDLTRGIIPVRKHLASFTDTSDINLRNPSTPTTTTGGMSPSTRPSQLAVSQSKPTSGSTTKPFTSVMSRRPSRMLGRSIASIFNLSSLSSNARTQNHSS